MEYIHGDLLETNATMICHQVNLQGVMGGGLAWHIARKYPEVEQKYIDYKKKELGEVCFAPTEDFMVANCFSQNEDYTTNYDALEKCLKTVRERMAWCGWKTVAFPYKYGCGIAKGDWNKVIQIIGRIFKGYRVLIYIKD